LFYFFSGDADRWRPLGWFYVVPLILFFVSQGRGYYLAPAYPLLFAGGAVWLEKRVTSRKAAVRLSVYCAVAFALLAGSALTAAITLPIAPIHSAWWNFASRQNGDLVEEIGWPDLVETIADLREKLTSADQQHLGILAGNYGEAGAINLYGPERGLPPAICGTNSYWWRSYPEPPPEVIIAIGFDREFLDKYFETAELVAHNTNRLGVANEETTGHPDIFLCRKLKLPWPRFWKDFQRFG
jgi:hypothetical protein